jgi:hypothetical protein
MIVMSEADVRELKAHRARAARNARQKGRRVPGQDYRGMSTRQAAYAPLYAAQGTVSLADLAYVARVHTQVLEAAVIRLVEDDRYTWGQVGDALGITRQAAQYRYGHLVKGRTPGAQPAGLR